MSFVFNAIYAALALGFLYFFYIKLIKLYLEKRYYEAQGIPIIKGYKFFTGHMLRHLEIQMSNKSLEYSELQMIQQDFVENNLKVPEVVIFSAAFRLILIVTSPEMLSDFFVAKNKYSDKCQKIMDLELPLMGHSIILSPGDTKWLDHRKVLGQAFYKDKLIKYVQIMKEVTEDSLSTIKRVYVEGRKEMDLIQEVQKIFMRIILNCALGQDLCSEEFDYLKNGVITKKTLGPFLVDTFQHQIVRATNVENILFPELVNFYWRKNDKENLQNIQLVRDLMESYVENRRKEMKSPDFVDRGDLLSYLLTNPDFKYDPKAIIDQVFTFFFAGSQTVSSTTANLIMYLMQQQDLLKKVRKEYTTLSGNPDLTDFDVISELSYYTMCFQESLRIEPPVQLAIYNYLTKDAKLGKYYIKEGTLIQVDIKHLHQNPDEWKEPERFIPERFDPKSTYFLTPDGRKRHPFSYAPFFGGKRICLGKTFAEVASKVVGPRLLDTFDFEFANKAHEEEKPMNHLTMRRMNACYVKLKNRQ